MKARERLHTPDVLKGLAIVLVVITHSGWSDGQRRLLLFPFWVDSAVPMFMFVSGYLNALSLHRRQAGGQPSWPEYFTTHLYDYVAPLLVSLIVECALHAALHIPFRQGGAAFLLGGGDGPGSYYFAVLVQMLFLAPVVHLALRRYGAAGLVGLLAANIVFEVTAAAWGMGATYYRMMFPRYLFVYSCGQYCWLRKGQAMSRRAVLVSCLVGAAGIFVMCYLGVETKLVFSWFSTSWVACLLYVPVLWSLMGRSRSFAALERIGMSSYWVFIAQKVYFAYVVPRSFVTSLPMVARVATNLLICLPVGMALNAVLAPPLKSFGAGLWQQLQRVSTVNLESMLFSEG